jgi:hypothetical protein
MSAEGVASQREAAYGYGLGFPSWRTDVSTLRGEARDGRWPGED